MKRFITLLIAVVFIGILLFAAMYWVLNKDFYYSLNLALCGVTGGLAAEYLKLFIEKRRKAKVTKAGK